MTWKLIIFALLVSSARAATIPTAVDEETCIDLCSSCDGTAKYEEGHCECSIAANLDNETECLGRMKRQANEYGLDVVSCDENTEYELRTTRCTLGSKHSYGKNDMERVAKYFMQDGPMTGSIFIAPPYTNLPGQTVLGKSSDCVGASQGIITQPAETMPVAIAEPTVGAARLITQPKEFMPVSPITSLTAATTAARTPVIASLPAAVARTPGTVGSTLNMLGLQEIAPQFLSMLGEVLTKPILGLPQAIKSVSEVPGVSDLVGAPANLLNSLADQMAEKSKIAKENLDNFREVVGKAREDVKVGLANLKESKKALSSKPMIGSSMKSSPPYSLMNPHPMINWLNPTLGAPNPTQFVGTPLQTQFVGASAPMQFVGSPTPTQFVGSPLGQLVSAPAQIQFMGSALPTQFLSAAQLVGTAVPSQLVGSSDQSQMVGASAPEGTSSSDCGSQMVGSPSPSNQMVGAKMLTSMPVIQSLGTIPLSSIVGQISPTYLVGSPMTYYPAVQTTNTIEETLGDANSEPSLEEIPLSSPPQKKICKKSTRDQASVKYTRDVKAVEENKVQLEELKIEETTTTTTTTEIPMIDRTTTQKPKPDKSVIGKIKPLSKKTKAEKKIKL